MDEKEKTHIKGNYIMETGKYVGETNYIELIACYIRVSHQEQKLHGLSLDAQMQKLEEYAAAHNMKIVEWYKDEGVSGRKLIKNRPELQRMIKDAQKGKFKRIIFIKLDRYFRSVAEFHECQKILDDVGVTWTATEEKYDMSTANGRAFVNMKLTIAELEADQTGERIRLVNEYKIKSGLPLFGTPSMPFCYEVKEPEHGEKHKYIQKRDEEIMYDLIDHVLKNQSVGGALTYINNKYKRGFRYNRVLNTLKNEMICGSYKGNPNYCTPYISRDVFDRIQKIIKRNPRTSTQEHTYIFTGLLKCPECGCRLSGTMHTYKRGDKVYRYHNYRCNNNRLNKMCINNTCVFENTLERQILERLDDILIDKQTKVIDIHTGKDRVSKYNLQELQNELDRLNYSWQKGRIKNVEEYDKRYDELMEQIDAANAEHTEMEKEPDYDRIREVLSGGWKETYKALDAEHKRAFWRSFVEEIQITWNKQMKRIDDVIFF